jgi:hypothetical protein
LNTLRCPSVPVKRHGLTRVPSSGATGQSGIKIQRGKAGQTGFTGFFGFFFFFPFPEEKEKENPPAAEGSFDR